uniref:RNA-directed RNA polymerase L n=1 Tax=Liverwort associated bunyavirus 3 TaxID=2933081 RepID=A0A9C7LLT3_9VIRU|nr:RNA-dependent RNA polymerase [Liverwort associated bunyavirus 3]CAI5383925.1 RNA-dependent RNA polymerase [Liverwort associated bunyavirus 3]
MEEDDIENEALDAFNESRSVEDTSPNRESCCRIVSYYAEGLQEIKSDPKNYYYRTLSVLTSSLAIPDIECQLNVIRNSYITACFLKQNKLISLDMSIHFVDLFFRTRHELFFISSMSCLGVDSSKSDVKFCDVLPIDSVRTPDYIYKDGTTVVVLECTATSNILKAAQSKGISDYGYSGKYDSELAELSSLGFNCSYFVLAFDVHDINNKGYIKTLKEASLIIGCEIDKSNLYRLESLRKEFIKCTSTFYSIFGSDISGLFNDSYQIFSDNSEKVKEFLDDSEKETQGNFRIISISQSLFDSISRSWSRMHRILEYSFQEHGEVKMIPYFEISGSKFGFEQNPDGLYPQEWTEVLVYENKSVFCSKIKTYYKSTLVDNPSSDIEFFSFENLSEGQSQVEARASSEPILFHHMEMGIFLDVFVVEVKQRSASIAIAKACSKYEDSNYESKIIDMINQFDGEVASSSVNESLGNFKSSMLAKCQLNMDMCEKAINALKAKQEIMNPSVVADQIILYKAKQPFIFPVRSIYPESYSTYKSKPTIALNALSETKVGPYTDKVISIASGHSFEWGTKQRMKPKDLLIGEQAIKTIQSEVLAIQKKVAFDGKTKRIPKAKEIDECKPLLKKIADLSLQLRKKHGKDFFERKEISTIRIKTSGKSLMSSDFEKEMEHFKSGDERSVYKGVSGVIDFDESSKMYENLRSFLLSPSAAICPDELYDQSVGSDIPLLKHLKEDYLSHYKDYYTYLKNTNIYHACCFISRYCHTLLYLSQTTLNSDYVTVDNLGYSDCIIICKGGKKIFPTRRSKLHRIFYPASKSVTDMFFIKNLDSSFRRVNFQGRDYIMTPWIMLHETMVTDGLSFLYKMMGFALMTIKEGFDFNTSLNRCFFNIILAIHGRRQTEVCLHNLRYIMVNCLADLTDLETMLPEFAGFNYDSFQSYIRGCIINRFGDFFKSSQKIKIESKKRNIREVFSESGMLHLFNLHSVDTLEDFSMAVYSTYLMSKAPVTQNLEQVANLKSMLETHKVFKSESSDSVDERKNLNYFCAGGNIYNYYDNLCKSDFNFDPSYMIHLGKFAKDYLQSKVTSADLEVEWSKELNKPWDSMANSSGLRGEGKEFFGRKGYYIVYDEVLKEKRFEEFLVELGENTLDERKIKKYNQTFREKIANKELSTIIFHVVDKIQRGGKREIFVMDKMTKVHQQVIENFMGILCKKCPTEMISTPSNKRLHSVHSRVFETKHEEGNEQYYWVLDCRKWAPRSMLEKFIFFISGMRGYLPETFIHHCYNFFSLMLKKQTHTRPHIVDIIKKSKSNDWIDYSVLISDESKGSVYFEMSYSWMMGIFNYFSSLVHVMNQLHASNVIYNTTMMNYKAFTTLSPIAHSDDSAAKQSVPNKELMIRSIMIYEILLKAANHLFSRKKSNIGPVYFEFLSILYMGGELLPLLPKFLGSFSFHPTDEGYCSDILDSYSKVNELVTNGSTFQQAYVSMKIQSMIVWRFYFGSGRRMNYEIPPQMFGAPDPHPICVILSGSDSDTLRLVSGLDGKLKLNKLSFIYESITVKDEDEMSIFGPLVTSANIKPGNGVKAHRSFIPGNSNISWTLKNVNFGNTYISAFQYVNKLKNPGFIASLQDDNLTRRISRSYYFRDYSVMDTRFGKMKQSELMNLVSIAFNVDDKELFDNLNIPDSESIRAELTSKIQNETKNYEIVRMLHSELMGLMDYWRLMDYDQENINFSKKTTKPIHISLQKTMTGISTRFEPAVLSSWVKEPQYRRMLPNTQGCLSAESELRQLLLDYGLDTDDLTVQTLHHILRRIKSKSSSNIYCYGNVPSGLREINTYQDVTLLLAHNSFENRFINGLTLPLGRMINVAAQQVMPELKLEEVQITCGLMNVWLTAYNTLDSQKFEDFLRLDFDTPEFLQSSETTNNPATIAANMRDYWIKRRSIGDYFLPLINLFLSACEDGRIRPSILSKSYFHCFTKRQSLMQDRWVGVGNIYVNLGESKVVVCLRGKTVNRLIFQSNTLVLTKVQINFLNFVLSSAECPFILDSMIPPPTDNKDIKLFGLSIDNEYMITEARNLKACIPELVIEPTLGCKLVDLEVMSFKMMPRMKIEAGFRDGFGNLERFVINLFTVDVEKSIYLARKYFSNTKNNEMISSFWNVDRENYIIDLISDGLEVDVYVSPTEIFKHYEYSKLFEIMQTCEKMEICKVRGVKVRDKSFPAQEGGILDMLIKYQMEFPDFNFKWDRVITPDLMALKSKQPEAFITGMVNKIRERYDALYTMTEKSQIIRELSRIIEIGEDGNREMELMTVMANWGYTGYAGAMESISEDGVGLISTRIFREYNIDFQYMKEFSDMFVKLLKALFNVILENQSEFLIGFDNRDWSGFVRFNQKNLKSFLISVIHNLTMSLYYKNPGQTSMTISPLDIFFYTAIPIIYGNPTMFDGLKAELSCHYLLSSFVNPSTSMEEIFLSYRCLLHCFRLSNKQGQPIDTSIRRVNQTDYTLPVVYTRDLCKQLGINFNIKKANYHGCFSDEFLTRLYRSYNVSFSGVNYSLWFKKVNYKALERVKFNHRFQFKQMLTEDFLESENFEEINIELSSGDPDIDEIETQIQDYELDIYNSEGVYNRWLSGKMYKQVRVSVLNFVGQMNPSDLLQYTRQAGNDVLILMSCLHLPLLVNPANYMFFQFVDHDWYNHSLNKHDHIIAVVLSNNIKQPQVWEQTLGAVLINKSSILKSIRINGVSKGRTQADDDYDSYNVINEGDPDLVERWNKEVEFTSTDVVASEQDPGAQGEVGSSSGVAEGQDDQETENYRSKLIDLGFEEESVNSFILMYEKAKTMRMGNQKEMFLNIILKLFSKQNLIKSIKNVTNEMLKMPLTEEQLSRIFQVPFYFGSQIGKDSTLKNNALKDKKLYSEIDSLTGHMCSKVISGTLTISPKYKSRLTTNIRLCNKLIKITSNNKSQKRFLIDFYTLLLNDAHVASDSKNNEEWAEVMALMNQFVDDDDEDVKDETNIYDVSVEKGRLPYRLVADFKRFE